MKRTGYIFISVIVISMVFSSTGFAQQQIPKGKFLEKPIFDFNQINEIKLKASVTTDDILFIEDFEGDISSWTTKELGIGTPETGPHSGYNSSKAAGINLTSAYSNNEDAWLISETISLPEVNPGDKLELRVHEWFEMESEYDNGLIRISTDGGETWSTVSKSSGVSDWRLTTVNLNPFQGKEIIIGFNFTSDGSINADGWFIDNVEIAASKASAVAALNTNISSINSQNFPYIYLNVTVDTGGVGVADLSESDFEVTENDVTQTDNFQVIPPETSEGSRRSDIIFVVDDTGSMGDEITSVRENIIAFADSLTASSIDFSLGLVTYKDNVTVFNSGSLTSDAETFKTWIDGLSASGGGDIPENAFGAIELAVSDFTFRPGSQKIVILITDAASHESDASASYVDPVPMDKADLVDYLNNASVTNYSVAIDNDQYKGEGSITEETGGSFFFVTSPFTSILDDIATTVGNNYVVRYRSSDPEKNGIEREVIANVDFEGDSDQDTTYYTPGAVPEIARTNTTVGYSDEAWAEDTEFEMSVFVTDDVEPFVQTVTVYYRTTGTGEYTSIEMTADEDTDDLYTTTLPASAAADPGLDYYFTSTDGEASSSAPSVNPAENPFQIAILPNEPPSITHSVITSWEVGADIPISAQVKDETNELSSVKLYFREVGQLTFTVVDMAESGGNIYQAEIPGERMTEEGVEYYIEAVDNFGVKSTSAGNADSPGSIVDETTLITVEPTEINYIVDVPHDQGGKVYMQWDRSPSDEDLTQFSHYSIWRAIPEDEIPEKVKPSDSFSDITRSFQGTAYVNSSEAESDSMAWEWLSNQEPLNLPHYSYAANTLYDSSSATSGIHYFMIVAHSSDPNVYEKSAPDSGYSIDNLAPISPKNVNADFNREQVKVSLTWDKNPESDLRTYRVYRGSENTQNLSRFKLIGSPKENSFVDNNAATDTEVYYMVLAEDVHDNLSETTTPVNVTTMTTSSEDENEVIPQRFELHQNYPNPFNPTTKVKYSLAQSSHVSIVVHDILGREVAVLIDDVKPAGTYSLTFDASHLTSGVYIYRMKTGSFTETRTMTLMK